MFFKGIHNGAVRESRVAVTNFVRVLYGQIGYVKMGLLNFVVVLEIIGGRTEIKIVITIVAVLNYTTASDRSVEKFRGSTLTNALHMW